jgi:hypothetical protein
VAGAALAPVPALAVAGLVAALRRLRTTQRRAAAERDIESACIETGELVALSLAAGSSIPAAFVTALEHAPRAALPPLLRLVGSLRRLGTEPALVADDGPLAPISHALAAAAAAGAPALPVLQAHLDAAAHRRHTAEIEAMRRLPVRLLLPLTLLVLPGFVIMTVGPVVVDSLARLNP